MSSLVHSQVTHRGIDEITDYDNYGHDVLLNQVKFLRAQLDFAQCGNNLSLCSCSDICVIIPRFCREVEKNSNGIVTNQNGEKENLDTCDGEKYWEKRTLLALEDIRPIVGISPKINGKAEENMHGLVIDIQCIEQSFRINLSFPTF